MTLKKLGRYEVLRVLGKGAMGVVYEGRDPNLDRRVAIKTVKVENLSEEAAAEYEHRFRTEARSAARLQHPNIVSVYDSDRDGDVAFLVMEYIQGDDLKHHLDRGVRYSLEQSLKIIRDLLSALDYAHKQGIVHRDIKPANLLIEPGGRVKLTDFGVARIQDSGEATRTQGSMVGTLKYMAPEQVQGQKIDSRADLFSAGVCLYQLLTDKRPFDGDNDFSIIHQIIGHNPPAPSTINAKLPGALDAVVARALAKTREERFATARDFAVALQAAIRRAEDQTVVPPQNPNRSREALSRPLTAPGTVPPGSATSPSVGASSVTQELELVYWKDVKDASDPEELQGFLDKFPAGIYADLARRRLRKLVGGESTNIGMSQPGTAPAGAYPGTAGSTFQTQFPDNEATRLRTDASRPMIVSDPAPSQVRPANWVQQEYTSTLTQTSPVQPPPPAPAPVVAPSPADREPDPAFAPTEMLLDSSSSSAAARRRRMDDDDDEDESLPPPPRRRLPMALLAGVAALAVAGVVATVMLRSKPDPESQAAAAGVLVPAMPVPAAAPAPAAPPPAPPDIPVAAAPVAAPPPPAAAPAVEPPKAAAASAPAPKKAASQPATRSARATQQAPDTQRSTFIPPPPPAATPRVDPEPQRTLPPPVAVAGNGTQAVDQCQNKMFLAKELCLTENCAKPGARNHPMCVKHREETRLREEGKVRQGPQQAP